ncbi:hypothetical protein [Nocardia sp. NPDC019395]|uniref:hypothetical protein n=1 Tax=Nocardia sp. NPDC019395 TaxID=3154686 RepID=UPI0033DD2100
MSRRHRVARTAAACGVALSLSAITGCGDFLGPDNCYVLPTTQAPAGDVAIDAPGAVANQDAGGATPDSPIVAAASITGVYQAFFAPATPTVDRMALVERGSDFEAEISGMANHIRTALTTIEIADVALLDRLNAELRFTLNISGNAVVTDQVGHAIKESDGWKIAATTMCGLVAISGGTSRACA